MSSQVARAWLIASCAGLAISAKDSRYWCLVRQASTARQAPQAIVGSHRKDTTHRKAQIASTSALVARTT